MTEAVESYLNKDDWKVKENSNVPYSLSGLQRNVAGEMISSHTLEGVYGSEIGNLHEEGDIHIHDLSRGISGYCSGWSLEDLLSEGFGGVRGRLESAPPKHFDTALLQIVNFLGTLQNEWAGAQAFNSVDTFLAPFIREDDLDYREIKQGVQKFLFNLNVSSRWGAQTPFTNLTLDLTPPPDLEDHPSIIGGELREPSYSDYQEEMNLFNKAFVELMLEGDADGRPFTFPIPTFNITDDFEWEDTYTESLFELTATYGSPYFSNFMNSDMEPEDIRSMCPLHRDEKVMIKSDRYNGIEFSSIGNLSKDTYQVFSDGKFVEGEFGKYGRQDVLKVKLVNNHEMKISKNHLNFIKRGKNHETEELKGEELKKGMYLPYSLNEYKGSDRGDFDLGFFVGAYAGDGSVEEGRVVFSLNIEQKKTADRLEEIAKRKFGANVKRVKDQEENSLSLKVNSKGAEGTVRDFVKGKKREKYYTYKIIETSEEFREGLLEGHFASDGGNRHRIYTSSKKMKERLNMLASTLGTTTSIWKDDREGRLSEHPNYAVLVYQLNRNSYGDVWFKEDGKLWVKIDEIEEIGKSQVFCFEVKNGEPMFTVGGTGILTHNCHLRLSTDELERNVTGGLFGSSDKTGSLGVVTLNLPRIGYLSESEDELFCRLEDLLDYAKESLEIKRKEVGRNLRNGLFPYTKEWLPGLDNHFSTIGVIGMNELALNFLDENLFGEGAQDLAHKIMDFILEKITEYQKETGNLYNLEATPAEGTSYRLARLDRERWSDIMTQGKEEPYYTNSTQLPVGGTDDLFEQIEVEEPLQAKYTGGTVFHTFLGERMSGEQAKLLTRRIMEESELPYITISPTYSICKNHGYIAGEHESCPTCGKPCEVYSRVVGYYRPVKNWNEGKQEEFEERENFEVEGPKV